MHNFQYQANAANVIFGSGTIHRLPSELKRLGLHSPLLLSTSQQVSQAEHIKAALKSQVAGIFAGAVMHTPVEVTGEAIKAARASGCDSLISIGGGSTIGLGKAISFRTGLYHLAIPTTYAGSEATPILGETEHGRKTTRSDSKILPGTIIYDVDLTMTLPASMSTVSGINAIAHAVDALQARNGNPIVSLMAQQGIKALVQSLPIIHQDPSNHDARSKALYGAWLCGMCLGSVGMSLHHKLCHTLGGSFNLPHAETHAIILPHALAYNAPEITGVMAILDALLPSDDGDAIQGFNQLLERLEIKRDLKSFGFQEGDIAKAADIACINPYWNPRQVEKPLIQELLRRAWAGEQAKADLQTSCPGGP
ncbi:unnamed protein product [Clonostachys solani]|uniref:Maleylacetate reductase n=1 Tax=Clonostachys solani TaxID=160281 RepID=A0A9N9ZMH8_9HYPO|nr:unnamed protein product [Clonostachys solani]